MVVIVMSPREAGRIEIAWLVLSGMILYTVYIWALYHGLELGYSIPNHYGLEASSI